MTVPFTFLGDAVQGLDYSLPNGASVTIPAGSRTGSLAIAITDDALDESDELIQFTMGTPTNANKGATISGAVEIEDGDLPPTVTLDVQLTEVPELRSRLRIGLTLSTPSAKSVTVPFTVSGSAVEGLDYTLPNGASVTIPAGSRRGSLAILITDDAIDESDELVQFTMGTPTNAIKGATSSGAVKIKDDDLPPTVTLDVQLTEVSELRSRLRIGLTLSTPSAKSVTVPFTVFGSAVEGLDYTLPNGASATIPAGSRTGILAILIKDDALDEGNERIQFSIGAVINAAKGATTSGTVKIADNDPLPVVSLSRTRQNLMEGGNARSVSVVLSAVSGRPVTVSLQIGGDARNGQDYTSIPPSVVVEAGSKSKRVSVVALTDSDDELNETVTLTINTATNATIGSPTNYTAKIIDTN